MASDRVHDESSWRREANVKKKARGRQEDRKGRKTRESSGRRGGRVGYDCDDLTPRLKSANCQERKPIRAKHREKKSTFTRLGLTIPGTR